MKRLFISGAFTLAVIILHEFVAINLLTIDFSRRVNAELFKSLRELPEMDTQVILFDIEYDDWDTVRTNLELLESYGPRYIGVNLCNIRDRSEVFDYFLSQRSQIVTCDCRLNSGTGTSRITTSKNEVTHFRTDKATYFEMQLTDRSNGLKERRNRIERINFRNTDSYYQIPLSEVENVPPDLVEDKTVLIGFLRDSLVTPMNDGYGWPDPLAGDMSDAQISANIISTINRGEFINEVNPFAKVIFILTVSLMCVGLIRISRTRFNVINIILAVVILVILNGLSSALIVIAFSNSYYVELNEMTMVLVISAILSVYWNTKDRRASDRKVLSPVTDEG